MCSFSLTKKKLLAWYEKQQLKIQFIFIIGQYCTFDWMANLTFESIKKPILFFKNLLFYKQEVTSPIKLKLFNFLFEGDEKIAWNMNFVSIKAKKNKNDKMILTLIKTKFMFQAIFSLPSNRKLNKVLNNFSLISEVWFFFLSD